MRFLYLILILSVACNNIELKDLRAEDQRDSVDVIVSNGAETTNVKPEVVVVDETKDCPSRVVSPELMKRVRTALVDHSNRKKFEFWQNNYGNENNEPENVRVVYVYKGVRYTLWNNPSSISTIEIGKEILSVQHEGWIAVWERPNGSRDQQSVDTYSDHFVGCVNYGIGDESRFGENKHYMRWQLKDQEDLNIQYHSDWQEKYARAIDGLAYTLGVQ